MKRMDWGGCRRLSPRGNRPPETKIQEHKLILPLVESADVGEGSVGEVQK